MRFSHPTATTLRRRAVVALAALLALALALAAPSANAAGARSASKRAPATRSAAPKRSTRASAGPSALSTGLVDSPVFQDSTDAVRIPWLQRADQIGSSWVRLNVYWSMTAPYTLTSGFSPRNPADPGYNWTSLDESVRQATAAHQKVLMMVLSAPTWAEGAGAPSGVALGGSWEPNASDLAAFAHALAMRYSGNFPDPLNPGQTLPLVSYFQAWNEPNLPIYIQPQWAQTSSGKVVPASPTIYRYLLNAFYAAVKAVQPRSVVISAGTAPYGDPPGVGRMAPALFLRGLFCLTNSLGPTACPNPPHLDGLDHHPYGIGPTVKARQPDDIALPDLWKITRIVRAARRYHRVVPAGPKPLWVTEVDWSSNPPNPKAPSLAVQARNLSLAFYTAWSQGVTHVFWYQLRDPLAFKKSFTGGGLFFGDGTPKPAATAYSFPFIAIPAAHSKRAVILWGKAPVPGRVQIQELIGGVWRNRLSLPTTAGGIFYAVSWIGQHGQFRAVDGATRISIPWVNR